MTCQGKKYIIKEIIVAGEEGIQGPPGEQGPPGPTPESMEASKITVTNPGYANQQEINDFLLYVPVNIISFSGGVSEYELGQVLTAMTFNWVLNKDVITQTLVGPPEMTPEVLTAAQRSVTVVLADLSSNATFTLTADDNTQQDIQNFNVSFFNKNYYGDAIIPGVIDSTFIKTLSNILKGNRSHSYVTDAVGSEYNWYCHPDRYGTPTFYANGFEGGWSLVDTISFTNDFGYTEDYKVWRSDNPDIGPGVNVVVS